MNKKPAGSFKHLIIWMMRILAWPIGSIYKAVFYVIGDRKGILGLSQLMSLAPGYLGIFLRNAVYSHLFYELGLNSIISFGTVFSSPTVWIGRGVFINTYCDIGQIKICDNVIIGPKVIIMSGRRQHIMKSTEDGYKLDAGGFEVITIGANTWIGGGAIIAANVGSNCIIGAGSVVLNDITDNQIVGGNPAKVIRDIQKKN